MATEKKEDIVIVKFVKGWSIYTIGDIAGFSEKEAENLIKKLEVAVEYKEKATK